MLEDAGGLSYSCKSSCTGMDGVALYTVLYVNEKSTYTHRISQNVRSVSPLQTPLLLVLSLRTEPQHMKIISVSMSKQIH